MLITYTPEDNPADRKSWEFIPGRVRQSEAAMIEKRYGQNWDKFVADIQGGNMTARRVLLWHLTRREHPALKFEDTPDFYADEVVLEHTVSELQDIRARVEKAGLPAADTETALTLIDKQISDAEERDDLGGSSGKATSRDEV